MKLLFFAGLSLYWSVLTLFSNYVLLCMFSPFVFPLFFLVVVVASSASGLILKLFLIQDSVKKIYNN